MIKFNASRKINFVGLGDPGVTCSPRDPIFAGSNPAEADGFFKDLKILSTSSGRDVMPGDPSLRSQVP